MNRKLAIAAAILALCAAAHANEQNGGALAKNGMNSVNNSPPPVIGIGIGVQAGAAANAQAAAKAANTTVVKTGRVTNTAKGGKASAGVTGAGNSNVIVGGSSYEESRRPVNSAYAAGLVASPGTCLGSASAGVQGSALGVAFGTTVRDDGCHLIRRMVVLDQLGYSGAALSLACLEDDNIREAMTMQGISCATGVRSKTWNVGSPNPVVPVAYSAPAPAKADRN